MTPMLRAPIAAGLLSLLAAIPLAAQRVTKEPAAAAPDTAWFAVLLNTDTLARETVVHTRARLAGTLRLLRPRAMSVAYDMALRPDGTVDSMLTTTVDGSVAARGRIAIGRDSAVLTVVAPGLAAPRVDRVAVAPGTLPFINLSSGVLEQILQRARRLGGDSVDVPLLAGPQTVTGRVRFVGTDSAIFDLGVEIRAAVAPDGALRGAFVPSQNVRFVRLPHPRGDTSPGAQRSDADPFAAPPGAPYTAENVTVRTPGGFALAGTLTLPRGASAAHPAPVVVTITGSGPQNRDSELLGIPGYHFFRQVADTLGRRGIGVLRLDDRGVGASDIGPADATSADFADDVRTVLAWLRARPGVDSARLGLLGHSEGGIVAPMVASGDSSVRAVALLAAPSRPGVEVSAHQRRIAIAANASIPPSARDSVFRMAQAASDSIVTAGGSNAWARFWWTYDPRPVLQRLHAAVLILNGETDQQVPPGQGAELASLLRAAGNTDVTRRLVSGVNHLFLDDPSGDAAGYAALPSKVVPATVTGIIADWFASRLGTVR